MIHQAYLNGYDAAAIHARAAEVIEHGKQLNPEALGAISSILTKNVPAPRPPLMRQSSSFPAAYSTISRSTIRFL